MKVPARHTGHPRVMGLRPIRSVTTFGTLMTLVVASGCASRVQGVEAGTTRLNTATTQASLPLNSSAVLTPQSSPNQPSGGSTPGATENAGPSPDADQTTALRARLRSIDLALDTDDAVARSMAVCADVSSGADPLTIAATVRAQFGTDLGAGTVIAIQNVVTNTFCQP